jgi:hypothetical protein
MSETACGCWGRMRLLWCLWLQIVVIRMTSLWLLVTSVKCHLPAWGWPFAAHEVGTSPECVWIKSYCCSILFIYLFNGAANGYAFSHIMRTWLWITYWIWKEAAVVSFMYYPGICLEVLRKIMNNLRIDGLRAEIWTRFSQIRSRSGSHSAATSALTTHM